MIDVAQAPQVTPAGGSRQGVESLLNESSGPLFQTALWIAFWVFLVIMIRTSRLFSALVTRIEAGSPLRAGDFELGAPTDLKNPNVQTVTAEGVSGVSVPPTTTEAIESYQNHSTEVTETIYLIHAAEVVSPRTERAAGHYWVKVWLEAYTEADFNECSRVTYRLHNSFKHPIIATEAKENQFELWIDIWGEFTVVAYVERKGKPPLWLTRYLDLPGRPPD
ncbi:hypothetical protein K9N68_21495 [Kovacikia minuta CCNUW1]|uniref:pYEATS domain-containing protein n=1 Tax=Kovacikia minuta TaxID=2931930 RepID=UPI001CCABC1F|nr:pYEATS domain-containing protein [Kovacikia minuta]UBF24273.1 hypothetical protein K9N68_21495 [Kovacikia minuta CCNUW1]